MNLSEMQRYAEQKKFGKIVKIIAKATVLHIGWEMDNECWLVEMSDGKLELFTTNHGGFYHMCDEDLQDAIREAQDSYNGLNNIRNIMRGIV